MVKGAECYRECLKIGVEVLRQETGFVSNPCMKGEQGRKRRWGDGGEDGSWGVGGNSC